jgi:hypothetical protein
MGRMTHRFLLRAVAQPAKITKRTQSGQMTPRFFCSWRTAAQLVPEITKRTQGHPSRRSQGAEMTPRFFARGRLPLNPCQKLRNEPKATHPGAPKAAG